MDLKKILLPRKNAKAERGCMVKTQEFMAEKKGIDVKNWISNFSMSYGHFLARNGQNQ